MSTTPASRMDYQQNPDYKPTAPPPQYQQGQQGQQYQQGQQQPQGQGPPPQGYDANGNQQQQRRNSGPRMIERVYYVDTCCCDCPWNQAVQWVAGLEFTWGTLNAIICVAVFATGKSAQERLDNDRIYGDDWDWARYVKTHNDTIIAGIFLHCAELILSIFLMTATSRRTRALCFFWIFGVVLISVGEVVAVIIDHYGLTFAMIAIIPVRVYFIYVVYTLAAEIVNYPKGPPVRRVLEPAPTVIASPYVTSPTYVAAYPAPYYGGYYGGYGYGYPYGYGYGYDPYYGGAALTGLAVGTGIGLGMGMGGGYDSYGGGGYYDSDF